MNKGDKFLKLTKLLLEFKANPNLISSQNKTSLDYVLNNKKSLETKKLLREFDALTAEDLKKRKAVASTTSANKKDTPKPQSSSPEDKNKKATKLETETTKIIPAKPDSLPEKDTAFSD